MYRIVMLAECGMSRVRFWLKYRVLKRRVRAARET